MGVKPLIIGLAIVIVVASIGGYLAFQYLTTKQAPVTTRAKEIRFTIGERQYFVDGEERLMDAPPIIIEEQVYVPVKYLAEAMGTQWDCSQGRISLVFRDWGRAVGLFVGRPVIVVCGEERPIPSAPVVREGQVYLPAKFVAEAFRYNVNWEPSTRMMIISSTQRYRMTETLRIGGIDKLWMPVPKEWDGIGMSNVKVIEISPQPDDIYEDADGNKIAFWETKGRGLTEYKIVFEADFSPVWYNIDPSKIGNYDTTSPEYQKYTKPSPWIESDNEAIVKLAHEIVGNERNPLIQARLIHDWVETNIGPGDPQTALETLEKRSSDCGGHSFLFIALCRALGIPARPVAGIQPDYYQGRFISRVDQQGGLGFHVWSEFYLPGYGWVQCDTACGEGRNIIGIDEPRIILSRGEVVLGHGIPVDNFPWFHIPRAIPNPHPQYQTNGEELSLTVEVEKIPTSPGK